MSQASASARVVLSGEHSVVYGYPAITSSINLAASVTVVAKPTMEDQYLATLKRFFQDKFSVATAKVWLVADSQIPIGSGLSSSTAVAAATFKSLAHHFKLSFSTNDLFDLLVKFESQFYPVSGMDQAVVAYGGLVKFQKRVAGGYDFAPLKTAVLKNQIFYLIDSGKPEETTAEMVSLVNSKFKKTNPKITQILTDIGRVTEALISSLEVGLLDAELFKENQRLLVELGVVGEIAQDIVEQIEAVGGVAKICGAGGVKTGSGILLAYHNNLERLKELISEKGWRAWEIGLS